MMVCIMNEKIKCDFCGKEIEPENVYHLVEFPKLNYCDQTCAMDEREVEDRVKWTVLEENYVISMAAQHKPVDIEMRYVTIEYQNRIYKMQEVV